MIHRRSSLLKRARGFTLVELMVTVAVIAIIASLAIPGLSHARRRANEASAISSLRTISTLQNRYRVRFGAYGTVTELQSAGLIDNSFEDSEKAGYRFVDVSSPTSGYWAIGAEPMNPGVSGDRYFFVDSSGVIRYKEGSPPGSTDPAIE